MRHLTNISFVLISLFGCYSWAAHTLVYTFEPNNRYEQCTTTNAKGGPNTSCITKSCSEISAINTAPKACFSTRYTEVLDVEQYKAERAETQNRITNLEQQLSQYRQQVARSQTDIIETMIRDPQFRAALARQIKADSQR